MNDKNYSSQTELSNLNEANKANIQETMKECLENSINIITSLETLYQKLLLMKKNVLDVSEHSFKGLDEYIKHREDHINNISSEKAKTYCHLISSIENNLADDLLKEFSFSNFSEKAKTALPNNNVTDLYNLISSMNEYLKFTLAKCINSLIDFNHLPCANKKLPLYSFNKATSLISKNAKPMAYYDPNTKSFIQVKASFDVNDTFYFEYYLGDILSLHHTFQKLLKLHDLTMEQATSTLRCAKYYNL